MAANNFGELFRITTWGESHGKAVGVVIDGCPAGLQLSEEEINGELERRAPGRSPYTSPRKEEDQAEILSGVFEGTTTGAPISILIRNRDVDSSKYEPIKSLMRPGHANFTYLQKYGIFDYRGGGRSSARETVCRVAAGAVAKKFLSLSGICVVAYVHQVGEITASEKPTSVSTLRKAVEHSPVFCPDSKAAGKMMAAVLEAKESGDSLGGVVEFQVHGVPSGVGDPVYQKLEGRLAAAMMGLPASKGFAVGCGFSAAEMKGSLHNDSFSNQEGVIRPASNNAGGILGGISTGAPIVGQVVFKPTSSIGKSQMTVDGEGKAAEFLLPEGSRHDPCVALRAPAIVEAMAALVIADALLMNRSARI